MRLTKDVRQAYLDSNDGFTTTTYYKAKNFREAREYLIEDGKLLIRSTGKTSWADSHFDNRWVAADDEVHRFLYKYQDMLLPPAVIEKKAKDVCVNKAINDISVAKTVEDVIEAVQESPLCEVEEVGPSLMEIISGELEKAMDFTSDHKKEIAIGAGIVCGVTVAVVLVKKKLIPYIRSKKEKKTDDDYAQNIKTAKANE